MLPAAHRSAVAAAFFGNFVVGCGVLVVPGMLDLLAGDLGECTVKLPAKVVCHPGGREAENDRETHHEGGGNG
ncbi:MAG: hypothetical protein ACK47O_05875, partial [Betaproteobacteria bacterium]